MDMYDDCRTGGRRGYSGINGDGGKRKEKSKFMARIKCNLTKWAVLLRSKNVSYPSCWKPFGQRNKRMFCLCIRISLGQSDQFWFQTHWSGLSSMEVAAPLILEESWMSRAWHLGMMSSSDSRRPGVVDTCHAGPWQHLRHSRASVWLSRCCHYTVADAQAQPQGVREW